MKKICSVLLILIALVGCTSSENAISGTVKIIGPENTEIINTQITLNEDEPTAERAIVEACKQNKLAYTLQSNMFDNFDAIPSTQTDGWILFANSDKPADAGAYLIKLEDGFTVEFRYVNYNQVFAQ